MNAPGSSRRSRTVLQSNGLWLRRLSRSAGLRRQRIIEITLLDAQVINVDRLAGGRRKDAANGAEGRAIADETDLRRGQPFRQLGQSREIDPFGYRLLAQMDLQDSRAGYAIWGCTAEASAVA